MVFSRLWDQFGPETGTQAQSGLRHGRSSDYSSPNIVSVDARRVLRTLREPVIKVAEGRCEAGQELYLRSLVARLRVVNFGGAEGRAEG